MSCCVSTQFPARSAVSRDVVRKDVILEIGDLPRAELHPSNHFVEQVFADVQITEAHVAHKPLMTPARTEVGPGARYIDRDRSRGLDEIGIDVGAAAVSQIAD